MIEQDSKAVINFPESIPSKFCCIFAINHYNNAIFIWDCLISLAFYQSSSMPKEIQSCHMNMILF